MSQAALVELQRAMRSCSRCVDAGYIPAALPIFHGNARARLMVVGQAPAPPGDGPRLPYSGQSGKTLTRWLERAGFEPGSLHNPDRFYLTSVTKCFPGRSTSGNGDRAPGAAEVKLCGSHLAQELRLVRPELILALGRLSITQFLPSVKRQVLAEIIGTPREAEFEPAGTAVVLPLPHPSGVSRWLNDPENRALVDRAMDWLSSERDLKGW